MNMAKERSLESIPEWEKFKAVSRTPGESEVKRCMMEANTVFVYSKGKKRYGHRYSKEYFGKAYMVLPETDKTTIWHKSLQRALKLMSESGLWKDIAPIYQNLLLMSHDDHAELKKLWSESLTARWNPAASPDEERIRYMREKYPFAFDEESGIKMEYVNELSDCILKSMYFGYENAAVKQDLQTALSSGNSYERCHLRVNYDVSVSYDPETKKAWYSEEYKDTGNGHYYLALNHSTAVFCEND